MVITKTPFRISFFGGGTDFPDYYKVHGGAVLSTTIDKYCYVTVRHLPDFFDYKNELVYSKTERTIDEESIIHPAIRESMKMMDMHDLRLVYEADLPARSGLGTSSSFAVGMLNAFYALKGKYVDKKKLSEDAIYLERVLCNESGGVQDQIAVAYGGLNRINLDDKGFNVQPIIISPERKKQLNDSLLLYFTGFSRYSHDIQTVQQELLQSNTSRLSEMQSLVDAAEKVLVGKGDLQEFGRMLDYTWRLKRSMNNKVSTDSIDNIYKAARKAGALGGKLLGAGGGGFMLFYVEPHVQPSVRKALKMMMEVPFFFENAGTSVLYYVPEQYERNPSKENERKVI